MSLTELTVTALAAALRARQASVPEVIEAYRARSAAVDPPINSFITGAADSARAAAGAAPAELDGGHDRGPLHGVPIGLKDLIETAGIRTTGGSKILADHVPTEDAVVVARLKAAGAIVIGKTNTHEFAFGPTTDNPHTGRTRNPWNLECIPGGSSGGSGAAVAARLAPAALGTDTGGSIRVPAALCGTVGYKPSYGLSSRRGVFSLAWSTDTVGPLTRSVADAALITRAMAGYDPEDPGSWPGAPPPPPPPRAGRLDGVRVGIPQPLCQTPLHPEVGQAIERAIVTLQQLGATVEDVEIPATATAFDVWTTIVFSEAATYHERWLKERPQDYGPDVLYKLDVGQMLLATEYLKAQQHRAVLVAQCRAALQRCTVLLTPPTAAPAARFNQDTVQTTAGPRTTRDALLAFPCPFNLCGFPALSLPCGLSSEGLPLAVHLVGGPMGDDALLRVAAALESALSPLPAPTHTPQN